MGRLTCCVVKRYAKSPWTLNGRKEESLDFFYQDEAIDSGGTSALASNTLCMSCARHPLERLYVSCTLIHIHIPAADFLT